MGERPPQHAQELPFPSLFRTRSAPAAITPRPWEPPRAYFALRARLLRGGQISSNAHRQSRRLSEDNGPFRTCNLRPPFR